MSFNFARSLQFCPLSKTLNSLTLGVKKQFSAESRGTQIEKLRNSLSFALLCYVAISDANLPRDLKLWLNVLGRCGLPPGLLWLPAAVHLTTSDKRLHHGTSSTVAPAPQAKSACRRSADSRRWPSLRPWTSPTIPDFRVRSADDGGA